MVENPAELQDYYLRNFHRDPSSLETQAYFNYVKLIEGDRMLGEIAEFRNRAGRAEQHRIKLIGPDGKPIYSGLFDGVTLARLLLIQIRSISQVVIRVKKVYLKR